MIQPNKFYCLLLALSLTATNPGYGAQAPSDIWLAPLAKEYTSDGRGAPDFLDAVRSQSDWSTVAQHVSVIKLYPYFVGHIPDDLLKDIMLRLRQINVKLALEARVLDKSSPCGSDGGDWTANLLLKIKQLGGNLAYLAMDEPLFHWRSKPTCTATIKDLATDVAAKMQAYKKIFPKLEVGDIEPVAKGNEPALSNDDILTWLDAYKLTTGYGFPFFHADIVWTFPWVMPARALMQGVRARGTAFGAIYNGTDFASSDNEWATQAVTHYRVLETSVDWTPDEAIFQTWVAHPSHVLPESDNRTLSGIVKSYLRFRQDKQIYLHSDR